MKKAQLEHYFTSIVALPPPDEIQTAVERSHFDVNDDEMTQMLAKWEPFSPHKLLDKSHKIHHCNSGLGPNDVKHPSTYHHLSGTDLTNSQKRNSFVNPPEVIAENIEEEEKDDMMRL